MLPPPVRMAAAGRPSRPRPPAARRPADGTYALVVARLAPEKGIDVAIEACRLAGVPLVVAGEGPERDALRARAARSRRALRSGASSETSSRELRAGAALAIVPSRSAETFGIAAAEAMAAGLPVVASRIGALGELLDEIGLVEPGDANALAEAIGRLWGDAAAGERGRARVRDTCSPQVVARALGRVYDGVADGA